MSKLSVNLEFSWLEPSDVRWWEILGHTPHDIYHRPEYVVLEAKRTGTRPGACLVRWESGALLVPILSREQPATDGSESLDAVSPYGYAGALLAGEASDGLRSAAVQELWQGLRELGYCSVFLRLHPLLEGANSAFGDGALHHTGDIVVIDLQQDPEALWMGLEKNARTVVRRAWRANLNMVPLEPLADYLEEVASIYTETMQRVGARPTYLSFDLAYFKELHAGVGDILSLVGVEVDGKPICVSLNSSSHGIVQSMLGGTRTKARPLQPTVVETYESMLYYREAGARYLNLGGGVGGRRDSLFRFKRSFSNDIRPFYSVRVVLDERRYATLVKESARSRGVPESQLLGSGFFPAYRAPV